MKNYINRNLLQETINLIYVDDYFYIIKFMTKRTIAILKRIRRMKNNYPTKLNDKY
ncbi:hypothetical protein L950_0228165 [Sphingobacterium sp. IITKGP-BTPF85]|nr:hypothetical protein L950_0228165 [Sphingobacterium sp. IITKGP-BTPF85]